MTEENPHCTDWCRDGAGGRTPCPGHPAVPEETMSRIRAVLAAWGIDPEAAAEERLREAVDPLYRLDDWGYHAIADALGKSHQWAFLVITGQG